MERLKIKGSNIPYFSISKENSKIISGMSDEDIAHIMKGMINFIYEGITPNFDDNKLLECIFDAIITSTDRLSKAYFSRADSGRTSAKKRIENKAISSDLTTFSNTDDKSIAPIVNNAINSPEIQNNDNLIILTDEEKEKVEEIYNSYIFQTMVIGQIDIKTRKNIENEFINITKYYNVYDYYSPIYRELERRFLNLIN